MKLPLILTAAAVFIAIVGALTFLTAIDKPIDGLGTQLILLAPVIAGLLGLQAQAAKIDKQTNGTNQALREDNSRKAAEIAALRSAMTPEQAASVPVTLSIGTVDGDKS